MPITQERMLRLLSAAQDGQAGLAKVQDRVADAQARAAAGADPAEVLADLAVLLQPGLLLADQVATGITIAEEVKHFKSAAGRNRNKAARQRRRRAESRSLEDEITRELNRTEPSEQDL